MFLAIGGRISYTQSIELIVGEPGIFSHVRSGKDRREVDAT